MSVYAKTTVRRGFLEKIRKTNFEDHEVEKIVSTDVIVHGPCRLGLVFYDEEQRGGFSDDFCDFIHDVRCHRFACSCKL